MSEIKIREVEQDSMSGSEYVETLRILQEEPVETLRKDKKRIPLTHSMWAKVLVFLLATLFSVATILSMLGIMVFIDQQIYTTEKAAYRHTAFDNIAEGIAYNVFSMVTADREEDVADYLLHKNVAGVSIVVDGPREFQWEYDGGDSSCSTETYASKWYWYRSGSLHQIDTQYQNSAPKDMVYASVSVPLELTVQDDFMLADFAVDAMYALRYWIYAIGGTAILLTVLSFVFLMYASGRRKGKETPQPGWGTRVPFDVLTAGLGTVLVLLMDVAVEVISFQPMGAQIVMYAVCGIAAVVLCLGWCMSAALRLKLGKWWENTVAFHVLRFGFVLMKKLSCYAKRFLRKCADVGAAVLGVVPLVWKTVVVFIVIAFVELLAIMFFRRDADMLVFVWALLHMAAFAGVIYIALCLHRLGKGGEALAAGDLSYQVDTRQMLPDFRHHAENLSRIGEGMTAAVEQRLKSERMKTELITNVSHDIKTPLTSIINYSDLICKEEPGSEKIGEYAEVLHRQSERLKRLVDDLVEASKASTGNLDVQLAPCEVGVMLSQTAGEYQQRLAQCSLVLVTKQPEYPMKIMADGRRLWRVFDNLMNNICKYAMPGTRVYLTLEEADGQAVISFKNTSREPLDLSVDELMERFVRGDAARNSEGNGLGLSIARSLTQLQNGALEITVDGDLFKAVLHFPMIR